MTASHDKLRPFDAFIEEHGFVVLDGGLATELEAQGAQLDNHLWSASLLVDNPTLIYKTHLAYFWEGADIATTGSYQASFDGFLRRGFNRAQAKDLLTRSVELAAQARDHFWQNYQDLQLKRRKQKHARNAVEHVCEPFDTTMPGVTNEGEKSIHGIDLGECMTVTERNCPGVYPTGALNKLRQKPLVAASIGCYGAALADGSEYLGDYGVEVGVASLKEWHRERLDVLKRARGTDLLLFETIPCLTEVEAILSLLQESGCDGSLGAVISISCRDEEHLRSGELVQDFAKLISQDANQYNKAAEQSHPWPVVGVGVNCTAPSQVPGVLRTLRETLRFQPELQIVLVAYPNSGEEWDADEKKWMPGTGCRGDGGARDFGNMAKEWLISGAQVIGGCCRTTPSHIKEINMALLSSESKSYRVQESDRVQDR